MLAITANVTMAARAKAMLRWIRVSMRLMAGSLGWVGLAMERTLGSNAAGRERLATGGCQPRMKCRLGG